MTKRYTLMIPGPVDVDQEILKEMGLPIVAHYGSDWVEWYQETLDLLGQVFQTKGDIFILAGSGGAGLDAAIGGFLKSGDRVLVLINGFFGERLFRIAQAFGLDPQRVEFDMLRPFSVEPVEESLKRDKELRAILMVHHETLSGVVNPLRQVGQLGKEYNVPLIVDAVSSVGALELKADEWGVDICVTGSQKGLEAPPGLALVSISKRAWEIMDARGPTGHGMYLDPRFWREYRVQQGNWHPSHCTLPGNIVLALRTSLKRILAEGLDEHFARYKRAAKTVRCGLSSMGFEPLLDEAFASPVVTTAKAPAGVKAVRLRDFLQQKRNILITFGPAPYKENSIRIGHMGEQNRLDHVVPTLCGLEDALRDCGLEVPYGTSLAGIHAFLSPSP